jgi:hypothetical protein
MAQQTINVGVSANDGGGDTLRASMQKINANFTETYGNDFIDSAQIVQDAVGERELNVGAGTTGQSLASDGSGGLYWGSVITGDVPINVLETRLGEIGATTIGVDATADITFNGQITATGQNSITFLHATFAGLPAAASNEGLIAYAQDTGKFYWSNGTQWVTAFALASDVRDNIEYIGYDTSDFIRFVNNTKMDFYVNNVYRMRLDDGLDLDGDINTTGDVIAYSTVTLSDINLKKDVEKITEPIEKINKLNGVTYKWKDSNKEAAGLIAQDVQNVLPQSVIKRTDFHGEEQLALDYNAIVGLLVEAVKDLDNRLKTCNCNCEK